jgi:hypothetical protein
VLPASPWGSRLFAGALTEFHGDVELLATAIHRERDGVAGTFAIQNNIQVHWAGDFLAVDGHDYVASDSDALHARLRDPIAAWNTRSRGGSSFRGHLDEQSFLNGKIQGFRQVTTDGKSLYAQVREVNTALGDQILCDPLRAVDRNGESDAGGRGPPELPRLMAASV